VQVANGRQARVPAKKEPQGANFRIVWCGAFSTAVNRHDASSEQGSCRFMSIFAGLSEARAKTAYK
jgi:hypothetical protein